VQRRSVGILETFIIDRRELLPAGTFQSPEPGRRQFAKKFIGLETQNVELQSWTA
jgi:hypothetical protein